MLATVACKTHYRPVRYDFDRGGLSTKGSVDRFHVLIYNPPVPSFAWRDAHNARNNLRPHSPRGALRLSDEHCRALRAKRVMWQAMRRSEEAMRRRGEEASGSLRCYATHCVVRSGALFFRGSVDL